MCGVVFAPRIEPTLSCVLKGSDVTEFSRNGSRGRGGGLDQRRRIAVGVEKNFTTAGVRRGDAAIIYAHRAALFMAVLAGSSILIRIWPRTDQLEDGPHWTCGLCGTSDSVSADSTQLKNLWRRQCVRRTIFRKVQVRVEGGLFATRPTVCHCATCQGSSYTKNEYSLFYRQIFLKKW